MKRLLVLAVGALSGCTFCKPCPEVRYVEVVKPVPVACPSVVIPPEPELPVFRLHLFSTKEEVAQYYHQTVIVLMGEVLKLRALLTPYVTAEPVNPDAPSR